MKNTSPEVDIYINKAPEFAQPILDRLRGLFHKACPDIKETIKWGNPCFEHKGIVCGIAAFRHHVGVSFWKGKLMKDPEGLFGDVGKTSMGSLKFTSPAELPSDKILLAYIKEAVKLNEEDIKIGKPNKDKPDQLDPPDYLLAELKKNKKAKETYDKLSPSHRKEYIEWLREAKTETTRDKRLATAIEWLAEGKPKNWKYMKKWD